MIAALLATPLFLAQGSAAELDRDQAAAARDRALTWIVETQRPDGAWGAPLADHLFDLGFAWETYAAYQRAACALACEALRVAPETPARRAALERALEWLANSRQLHRGADWDVDATWGALYGFVALSSAAADARFAQGPLAEPIRARALAFWRELEKRQTDQGGWAYYDDPPFSARPTWATSFCTALVLPAMLVAREELGWPVGRDRIERALRYVQRCALPNGAFAYDQRIPPRPHGGESIDQVQGSLGRIQVCHWALARGGVPWVDEARIRRGLEDFFRHHRFLEMARMRPIPHEGPYRNAGYFYHFASYYAAQAIELLPRAERESWHRRLRPKIVKTLFADGSTSDFLGASYQLVAGTSYAALALSLGLDDLGGAR